MKNLAALTAFVGSTLLSLAYGQDIDLTGYTQTFSDDFNTLSVTTSNPKGSSTWYFLPPYGAAGAYSESTWDIDAFSVKGGVLSNKAWIVVSPYTTGTHCYGPLGLKDSSGSAIVTGETLGMLANNYTGWVGMEFTTGSSELTVSSLGRWVVSGNTQTHQLILIDAATGLTVPNGLVSVNTSGATAGAFLYANLSTHAKLAANHSYYVMSYETNGGDQWYDSTTTVTTGDSVTVDTSEKGTWHSGNLSSMDPSGNGFGQEYGYFEIRAEMPSSGTGAWPAFWMETQNSILNNINGTSNPNMEIDIFEWYGTCFTNNSISIQEATHNWTPSGGPPGLYSPTTPMPNGAFPWQGFHIYGCQVDPVNITWYIDGVQTNQIATPSGYITTPFYMMADYAVGGGWPLTGMVNQSKFKIDWIRAYSLPASGTAPIIGTQPANQTALVGQTATFTVEASGSPGMTYQWSENGAAISGATSNSYTTVPEVIGDNGATFSVAIANGSGSVISSNATLSVSSLAAASAVVVDVSGGTGITEAGTWTESTSTTPFYGSYYLHDGNAGGGKSVQFTPTLLTSGGYEVFAWWTGGGNRATNSSYTIKSAQGTTSMQINEQTNGGQWVSLGTYSFNSGMAGSVTISDKGANGYVIADAIAFVPVASVIVDDAGSGVTEVGTWTSATTEAGYYDTDYLEDDDAKGGKSVTFTPTLPSAGTYQVLVWYPAAHKNSSNVPISVNAANGTIAAVPVSQQLNGGQWISVGTYSFNAGASVTISDTGATGFVIADAVQFVQQW